MAENDDFQGFSEDFGGLFAPKLLISRELREVLVDLEKKMARIQAKKLRMPRAAPKHLLDEEEMVRSNLAHLKRMWGLDGK